jgi:hypothetical protein
VLEGHLDHQDRPCLSSKELQQAKQSLPLPRSQIQQAIECIYPCFSDVFQQTLFILKLSPHFTQRRQCGQLIFQAFLIIFAFQLWCFPELLQGPFEGPQASRGFPGFRQ